MTAKPLDAVPDISARLARIEEMTCALHEAVDEFARHLTQALSTIPTQPVHLWYRERRRAQHGHASH